MNANASTHLHHKPARYRHWVIWLTTLLAALALLAGWIGYQHRIALLTSSANTRLLPYGLQIEALQGLQMSTSSLRIRQIVVKHEASGALQTLRDITVHFNAARLISGQIDRVSVAAADINLPPGAPVSGNSTPAPASRTTLTDILANIPFDRLDIGQLRIAGDTLTGGPFRAEELAAELARVRINCRPERCQIGAQVELSLHRLHYVEGEQSIALELVSFVSDEPIDITLDAASNTLAVAAPSLTLALPAIRADDTLTGLVTSIRRLTISQTLSAQGMDPTQLYAYAEVSVRELYTNLVSINLWSMQLDQRLTWQRGALHAGGTVMLDNQLLFRNELQHDLTQQAGQGTLEAPGIAFNDGTSKLSDLWSPLPWQADVVSGTVSARAQLNWHFGDRPPLVTGPITITLDSLSGYFNEIAFLRLSSDIAVELLPDWQLRSTRNAPVNLASVDAGIEFTNFSSDFRVDSTTGTITVTDASLNVFGGTVSSEQLDYKLQDNDSRFTVVIDSIDLNRVLGMSAYRGVSATGLVSGQLPVRLQGLTPSIRGGSLSALQPGGTIRYDSGTGSRTAGNMSLGNQSLDLVYQALEHYRFTLMETQVDYQESGELDLAIRMEGISPELNGGQRINLNLNINDDIPALLQSLQAARSVTDSIQSRLDDSLE